MKKILSILILSLLFYTNVNAGCDDAPVDGGTPISGEQQILQPLVPTFPVKYSLLSE